MEFFDKDSIGLGLSGAGEILERGAAAMRGQSVEFDLGRQKVAANKLVAFKAIKEALEDLALSDIEDPKIIGPKVKQLQKISKELGVPFDDKLAEHYTNNPLALGMAFDKDIDANLTPQEQKLERRLQLQAMRGDMKAEEALDQRRMGRLGNMVVKTANHLFDSKAVATKEEALRKSLAMHNEYIAKHPKYNTQIVDAAKKMMMIEKEPARVNVGEHREALALEMGLPNFAAATPEQKRIINEKVGLPEQRAAESLAVAKERELRLSEQFAQSQIATNRRMDQSDERIRLEQERQKRLLPAQEKVLTQNKLAMKAIDDYSSAFENFMKESKGAPISDMFRGAIAKNANAQRAVDLVTATGRTPAEKTLAAKYNTIVGNIKSLTDEVGVLTDTDAGRILRSFDLSLDANQVRANLRERRNSHQRTFDTAIESYDALGKDVSKFLSKSKAQSRGESDIEDRVNRILQGRNR